MEITIKGKLSYKDYKDFLVASLIHKKLRLALLIFFVAILMYTCISTVVKSPNVLTAVIEFIPIIILFLIYFIICRVFIKRSYSTDSLMQKEMSYTFTEHGIHWSTEQGSYDYRIEDFKRFIFSKKIIAIYISNRKAIVIPRHFFESKEQESEIEKLIKEKYITSKN